MIFKILRLTPRPDVPMHGNARKAAWLFAMNCNEHAQFTNM
ncbi:MAG: hypothetical protein WA137_11490 [Methanothrix sp.]